MAKLTRIITTAVVFALLGASAFAASRTNSSTTQTNLHIQVNVVQVVMTNQNPKAMPETAVSYSISTVQPRMSVSKEIHNMQVTGEKTLKTVEITTVVAE